MALLKLEMAAGKKESAPLAVSANNKGAGGGGWSPAMRLRISWWIWKIRISFEISIWPNPGRLVKEPPPSGLCFEKIGLSRGLAKVFAKVRKHKTLNQLKKRSPDFTGQRYEKKYNYLQAVMEEIVTYRLRYVEMRYCVQCTRCAPQSGHVDNAR